MGLLTHICPSIPTRRVRSSLVKPFISERTIISAATPSDIPAIEIREIIDMIIDFGGLWAFIKQLDLDVIIRLFIDAIMNFVSAMVWPMYWIKRIDTNYVWVWFVAAYFGYWLGLKLAHRLNQRQAGAGQ